MKTISWLMLLCLACSIACANEPTRSQKRLFSITFAGDDKDPTKYGHIVRTLYLTEDHRRSESDIYDHAIQGGDMSADADAAKQATECLKLLSALPEPKDLPLSPNRVVTVKCVDGDKELIKRFDAEHMPREVLQMLHIVGFPDATFKNSCLKFID